MEKLDKNDLQIIKAALEVFKLKTEQSPNHPSYEFKQEKLKEIEAVKVKLGKIKT